jgi:hypothetical protein
VVLPLSLVRLENHVCLSCGVQVIGVAWQAAMRIVVGIGDLVQRTGNGLIGRVLDGQTIERSGDAVCDLHCARGDEEHGFLGFTSKPMGDGLLVIWPQNHWVGSLVVWPQNHWDGFSRFGLKTGGDRFPGLGLETSSYDLMIWASKSPQRFLGLCLKTKRATVCRLCHKTDGRMKTVRGTHRDLAACFT